MTKNIILSLTLALAVCSAAAAGRSVRTLAEGWQFTKGDGSADSAWQNVRVPHDWAIYGPFDRENDLQTVAVEQNGETVATVKTGRTAGLPFIGKGTYRTSFEIPDTCGRSTTIVFDGAMSNAHVRLNGQEIIFWPYGYNSFHVTVDGVVRPGTNFLEVSLENKEQASRWYPGAGLYRNVHIVSTDRIHIPVWGTYVTTPHVADDYATVNLKMKIAGAQNGEKVNVVTEIIDPDGNISATDSSVYVMHGQEYAQNFLVRNPRLWHPDDPALYVARTRLFAGGRETDCYETRFGIRTIEYIPERGFFLNGEPTKFKGVCNHHDLGALGAAVNRSALKYQIELLKDMGANAIRTSHNMPAPELVELCDEMGMMLMIEPFDDWSFRPKSPNGYGSVFAQWAERDLTNMVEHYRNSPSVVMWSSGNEVPSQWGPDGVAELTMIQNIIHKLDPTRPVTCGMDQIGSVLDNGFAAATDIPGFNYKPQHYRDAYSRLPQKMILGSETASTVSSRGKYYFPLEFEEHHVVEHPDHQSNGYDNETCFWSNTPDLDFAMDDDCEWVLGQFVWTGFDYLGEPSPYDTDAWPSHSSVFGIFDLAWLPKDRMYLYRSQWNKKEPTLHVAPHWTWPGREGEVTPVQVYTSFPEAELFVNGISKGRRAKNPEGIFDRYRIIWPDVVYEPGEIRVVAYNSDGQPAMEKTVRTAGKAKSLALTANRSEIAANGDELVYLTVTATDKNGNFVPVDERMVQFEVSGAGSFEATANGDPTCLLPFQQPRMKLFSGAATVIVRGASTPGTIRVKAKARGLRTAEATITVKNF